MSGYLDPQPFREWYAKQKEHYQVEEIARWFGVDPRTLRRWDDKSGRIRRGEFEDAVMRSHFSLWDIYPALAEEKFKARGPQHQPGYGSKLTDDQVFELHGLHVAGCPVKTIAERIWQVAGYSSWQSAEWGIRAGFRRLGLPVVKGLRYVPPTRRCAGDPDTGAGCGQFTQKGSDHCWHHDPTTTDEERAAQRRGLRYLQLGAA